MAGTRVKVREAVRAILITPEAEVLLMRIFECQGVACQRDRHDATVVDLDDLGGV